MNSTHSILPSVQIWQFFCRKYSIYDKIYHEPHQYHGRIQTLLKTFPITSKSSPHVYGTFWEDRRSPIPPEQKKHFAKHAFLSKIPSMLRTSQGARKKVSDILQSLLREIPRRMRICISLSTSSMLGNIDTGSQSHHMTKSNSLWNNFHSVTNFSDWQLHTKV